MNPLLFDKTLGYITYANCILPGILAAYMTIAHGSTMITLTNAIYWVAGMQLISFSVYLIRFI